MISRKTTLVLGEIYQEIFSYQKKYPNHNKYYQENNYASFYDFLYSSDFEIWFCNRAKMAYKYVNTNDSERVIKEFIMTIQTGEFLGESAKNWTNLQREKYGQEYLRNLSQEILKALDKKFFTKPYESTESGEHKNKLIRALALDGYIYREGILLLPEQDVINVEEERRTLHVLYQRLNLADKEQAFKFLDLSEEHYIAGRWEDTIGNARKFFEQVLSEVANTHSIKSTQQPLNKDVYERPVEVRKYLQKSNLMEEKEVEAIRGIYGLLSETGGHPKTAKNDQARLLRHLALTLSQFAMLRLEGFLKP